MGLVGHKPTGTRARTGLKTAYVIRPLERGPGRPVNRNPDGEFDYTSEDFNDLARQLGA